MASSAPGLSVAIMTFNESQNIRACLESAQFADEIVIVDSGSTDDTVKICREYTDKIIHSPWSGCGQQKQKTLDLATQEWVLSLDADERISPSLQQEIRQILTNSKANGYEIPFHSFFCGKRLRFGDWFQETHLRLFKRNSAHFEPRIVHSRLFVQGKISKLKHPILHFSYPDLSTVIRKMNTYSSDAAQIKFEQGKTSGILTALFRSSWTFIRGYILKCGFLDGKEGLLLAIYNSQAVYYRYLKLMYLNKFK